ncbi:MAG: LTA synthase family protein [Pseudomonadota bacterium]
MVKFKLMTAYRSKTFARLVDGVTFLFLVLVHFICLKFVQGFDFYGDQGPRWLSLVVSCFPVLFFYFASRVLLGPLCAFFLVASIETALNIAHMTKVSILFEALSWADISEPTNLSIITHYLHSWHIGLIIVFLVGWLVSYQIDKRLIRNSSARRLFYFALALLFFPTVFYTHLIALPNPLAKSINNLLEKHGVIGLSPNWVKNVRFVGLPYHLILTSKIKMPEVPTDEHKELFRKISEDNIQNFSRPRKIILVLCESCWFDKNNFSDVFEPLRKRGFGEFRSISPAYGGATPNAAFEVLTGLPAQNETLRGVIYQEYASSIDKKAHALPRHLLDLGYRTIALHNYDKHFWHRHIVNPKFGFEKFVGIQDMEAEWSGWPEDSILYEHALKALKEHHDEPLFMYLTTVYTHGPYENNRGDLGARDYRTRAAKAIQELSKFVDQVSKVHPDTLFIVYGDHKPALNDYFLKNGVLKEGEPFGSKRWEPIGDVPIFIRASDPEKVNRVLKAASGLPFFCMSEIIDEEFLRSGVPAFNFSRQEKLCTDYKNKGYGFYKTAYPNWLYALSLFPNQKSKLTLRLHSLLDF